jgi:hypothetical protein
MRITTLVSALALTILACQAACALDAAPAPDSSATAAPAAKDATGSKAARSAECSRQADAKGLHGEKRRKFRETCKKAQPNQ